MSEPLLQMSIDDFLEIAQESSVDVEGLGNLKKEIKAEKEHINDIVKQIHSETDITKKKNLIKQYLKYLDDAYSTIRHANAKQAELMMSLGATYLTGACALSAIYSLSKRKIQTTKDAKKFVLGAAGMVAGTGLVVGNLPPIKIDLYKKKMSTMLLKEHEKYQRLFDKLEKKSPSISNESFMDSEIVIAEESLRGMKNIYDERAHKIYELYEKADETKNSDEQRKYISEAIKIIDQTISDVDKLREDALDKGLSAGSKLVKLILKCFMFKNIFNKSAIAKKRDLVIMIEKAVLNGLVGASLNKFNIKQKRVLQRDIISELLHLKKCLKEEFSYLDISNEALAVFEISTESLSTVTKSLVERLHKIGYTIRVWIQRVVSWINTKLYKMLDIKTIEADVHYYNSVIGMINSIMNTGSDPKTYVSLTITTFKSALQAGKLDKLQDDVAKLQSICTKVQEDLKLLEGESTKVTNLKPDPDAKKVAVPLRDMQAIKSYLDSQAATGKVLLTLLNLMIGQVQKNTKGKILIGDISEEKRNNVYRVGCTVSVALTNLMMKKTSLCMQLLNAFLANYGYAFK